MGGLGARLEEVGARSNGDLARGRPCWKRCLPEDRVKAACADLTDIRTVVAADVQGQAPVHDSARLVPKIRRFIRQLEGMMVPLGVNI